MFDGILKSKFFSKCKSNAKTTMKRIELIKRRRNAMQKYLKNDIIELLEKGLDTYANAKVEGLMMEMRKSDCYDLIDQFCSHILTHVEAMEKQKNCPENCNEAVSSLMYAAARVADLPELRDLRNLFSERYGDSLDIFVNKQLVEKLSSGVPSKELQLKFMHDLAEASGLHHKESNSEKSKNHPQLESIPKTIQKPNVDEQRAPETENHKNNLANHKFIPPPYVKSARTRNIVDKEEEMLDEVLEYYSKRRSDGGLGGIGSRVSSLPKERSADSEVNLGNGSHGRAASFNNGIRNGHVHPKLPDYDEFVARFEKSRLDHGS